MKVFEGWREVLVSYSFGSMGWDCRIDSVDGVDVEERRSRKRGEGGVYIKASQNNSQFTVTPSLAALRSGTSIHRENWLVLY